MIIRQQSSEKDKRAKFVMLTQKGKEEVKQLISFTKQTDHAFDDLEGELGCQLTNLIRKA